MKISIEQYKLLTIMIYNFLFGIGVLAFIYSTQESINLGLYHKIISFMGVNIPVGILGIMGITIIYGLITVIIVGFDYKLLKYGLDSFEVKEKDSICRKH